MCQHRNFEIQSDYLDEVQNHKTQENLDSDIRTLEAKLEIMPETEIRGFCALCERNPAVKDLPGPTPSCEGCSSEFENDLALLGW